MFEPDQPDRSDQPGEGAEPVESVETAGVGSPVAVPAELEVVPAGAVLCELLDELAVEAVSGFDTVRVVKAAYRQACRQWAVFLQALAETGLRVPGSADAVVRRDGPDEFGCEEARAGLVWSRTRAFRVYRFAVDVFVRLPVLGEAMLTGRLDEPRARALVDWTAGLTDAQAEQVCAGLVEVAPTLVVGELVDRIKRACVAIDPGWAERQYRQAVQTRTVSGSRNPDGTANLAGYHQPVDRVAAAAGRIDTLARACKRAGDRRRSNLIRSDLYLGMIDGAFEGLTDDQIINHVLNHPYTDPGDTPDTDNNTDGDPDDGPGGNGDPGDRGPGGRPDGGGGPGGGAGRGGGPRGGVGAARADRAAGGDAGSGHGGQPTDPTDRTGSSGSSGSAGSAGVRWAVPELRVRLSTLLGLDQAPGQLPGWDYVPAWLARHLIGQMHAGEWRYVLCGPDGRALAGGLITTRPRPPDQQNRPDPSGSPPDHTPGSRSGRRPAPRRDRRRGGIVEIAVTTTELTALTKPTEPAGAACSSGLAGGADRYRRWVPVIEAITRATTGSATATTASMGVGEATRRVAGARLRRWIEIRDRRCLHPTCRAPAASTDQDHRTAYAAGGPTHADNLTSACRHDHRLKHDGGWQLDHTGPDTTVWTSPLGHRYPSRPPPVIPPLPDPHPDNRGHRGHLDGWLHYPPARCRCHRQPEPDHTCICTEPILPPTPARIPDPTPDHPPDPTFDPNDEPPF